MAAAPDTLVIFDLEYIIGCDRFLEKCKQSKTLSINVYCIILTIKGVEYYCSIEIFKNNSFELNITNELSCLDNIPKDILDDDNITVFLQLCYIDNMGEDNTLKTTIEFAQIPDPINSQKKLPKLETIIYLRCFFYRMINVTFYRIQDVANGTCENAPKSNYNLFLYRLYATSSNNSKLFLYDIDNVSIYYKFFNKIIYTTYFNKNVLLQRINLTELKEQNKDTLNILKDFNKMRDLKYDGKFIRELLHGFGRYSDNCNIIAPSLKDIYKYLFSIQKHNEHHILFVLRLFYVNNKDCIYYPKDMPNIGAAAQPGGDRYTKKRRYRKKHRQSTRK